ncbi:MAG: hypothetical protein QOK57_05325 [Nitrososphaeraceae archaeon]|nr:hypothetical protein [Nitrososphaeraceae archaeon]
MTLQEIDKLSVTILMDNSTDLLLTNSIHANRPQLTTNEKFLLPLPIAEHGFSALVDIVVHSEEKKEKNNMGKKIEYKNNILCCAMLEGRNPKQTREQQIIYATEKWC